MRLRFRRRKIKREPIGIYIVLGLIALVMILPLYLLVINAFKPLEELFLFPPRYYVMNPTTTNFTDLLVATNAAWIPFSRYLFNSVFITVVVVTAHVVVACMCAYPLAKSRAPGVKLIFNFVVASLMFSPLVTNIPRYLIVNSLGMIDTYWALILPGIAGSMGVFLMKQFLEQVPTSLIEAARIDGSSEWNLFWKLIMPLSRPAWATLTIFAWLSSWNDEWSPLVFTRSEAMKTLPLAIHTMFSGSNIIARAGASAAASLLQTAPTIMIFLFLQKRVISTMAHAGIK
ncbi:MAG TPA: carbohydrate ABC transporter permease [Firmicutes bacterium]|jgi:ABC-type glycerol-3-phosphate transport system permease component|nr:carbohydrate ABC transporter permease [Bacillota bacterium]